MGFNAFKSTVQPDYPFSIQFAGTLYRKKWA
jgi:hypothetical protein